METTLDIVDWNELKKFEDTEKFAEWRLNVEKDPAWIRGLQDVGWLETSTHAYFEIGDGLDQIVFDLPVDQAEFLRKSLLTVICPDEDNATADFPCIPESCYFITLSPESVASIAEELEKLDLVLVSDRLTAYLSKDFEEDAKTEVKRDVDDYLLQVVALIKAAHAQQWGILGHMG